MTTPSSVAGRYRLDRRLGAGGMSTVFLAHDTVLERPVAVKLLAEHLAEDEAFVARFRREALAAARLQHPNIVQVFDSGEDEPSGRHYIVMEYVDGPSGADLLRTEGTLPVDETVGVIRDACHGLDYAHRAGVVHRDVKPGNLLLSEETGAVKIADFGIAKAAEQTRITQVGAVLGTAAYLSPEQAKGEEAGPASDVYSLGVCAYQFLAGRLPHEYGSLTELALKQQNDAVVPITTYRPEVPPELDRAVRVCLERDPTARYGSALDLATALEAGLRGEDTAATAWLAAADAEATQALPYETEATQVLPVPAPPPPPPPRRPVTEAPPAPVDPRRRAAERARRRRRRMNALIAAVIGLLALAAVIIALQIASSNGGAENIDNEDIPTQVDELIEYIRDHRE